MQPLAVWTRAVPSSFCVTGPVVVLFVHDENIAMEVHTGVECQEGYIPVPTEDSPLFPSLFVTDYYPAPGGIIEVESFTGPSSPSRATSAGSSVTL